MDYIVHGILQARILEWAAIPFSWGSSQLRDQTQVSHIAGGFFIWATREAHFSLMETLNENTNQSILFVTNPGSIILDNVEGYPLFL